MARKEIGERIQTLIQGSQDVCEDFGYCLYYLTHSQLKLKSILQNQALLNLIAQIQCPYRLPAYSPLRLHCPLFAIRFRPFNADLPVIPCHTTLIIRMPEIVDLVSRTLLITQNQKAMCKALRDEELLLFYSGQRNAIPFAVGRRITSSDQLQHRTQSTYSAHQLALRILFRKCSPRNTPFVDID